MLTGACQFGHGAGGSTSKFIHGFGGSVRRFLFGFLGAGGRLPKERRGRVHRVVSSSSKFSDYSPSCLRFATPGANKSSQLLTKAPPARLSLRFAIRRFCATAGGAARITWGAEARRPSAPRFGPRPEGPGSLLALWGGPAALSAPRFERAIQSSEPKTRAAHADLFDAPSSASMHGRCSLVIGWETVSSCFTGQRNQA